MQEEITLYACLLYAHTENKFMLQSLFASLTCSEAFFSWSQYFLLPASSPPQTPDWVSQKIIKFKILTGSDWYDLQLKEIVYQLTLPKSPILKSLLEHQSVSFLWWILHAYTYKSDTVEILDVNSLKPQISI